MSIINDMKAVAAGAPMIACAPVRECPRCGSERSEQRNWPGTDTPKPCPVCVTPGPWRVGEHPGDGSGTDWRMIEANSAFGLRMVGTAKCGGDAELMAAAPELLAALKFAQARLFIHEGQSDAYDAATAAIAKAQGE